MTLAKLNETFPGASWEFLKIAEDIADRVEDPKDSESILQAIDEGLIYTRDQWEVLAYYCTPSDANLDYAMEQFANDLIALMEDTGE